ncbi:hypothetical protein CABS02_02686 [Colletotrichum abscissum]|uniref:Uncharacterized protein n=1 Tax=Colletotrichum abscissum TaxID=1671311 RepID=A0A9Q0B6M6_9PEZI|nr:hypothetical protein CABS02_02686 [Colletotrichum abscissum]
MCEWNKFKYVCGHESIIAEEWCFQYSLTQKRCKVKVKDTFYEQTVCGNCMIKATETKVPWEHLIDRSKDSN